MEQKSLRAFKFQMLFHVNGKSFVSFHLNES